MDEDDEDPNDPVVGEIAEHNEKIGEGVVKQVLVEISFGLDEGMNHQPIDVLT